MGRKTQTFEKIGTGTNILLSQTDYNPIGQVMAKHLHGATGAAPFLQDISYKYNERGWLKRINDPALAPTTTRLFSEQLNYDSVRFAATPMFNGNITEQMFQAYNSPLPGQQHVVYAYDPLNRLNSGLSTTTLNENVTYDNLGNITALTRGGATGYYSYSDTYNANRLVAVSGLTNTNYTYDLNGNMNHDGKNNATLTYNLLNLPQTITATTPTSINITYTYDANGQKLRKVSNGSSTDYIGGIQYKPDAATIDFIQTEEGRAINSGGNYIYEYTLTDHLGNNRVTFDQTNGKVGEEDYYPFGLNVDRKINATNKYLYNKKELQDELTEYDYGARFYDPVVARWTTIDPLAEASRKWSPYNYGMNNPVRMIDPDGMSAKSDSANKVGADGLTNDQWIESSRPDAGASLGSNFQQQNENETDEPPINLYKGISPRNSMFYQAAESQPYTKGDGKFYIYGHGDTEGLEYFEESEQASFSIAFRPKDINNLLAARSPEWKKAMAEGKKITAIFYACQVGATEVIGTDGKLQTRIPIAQVFSKMYPNVTVIAPNGYVILKQIFREGKSTSAVVAIHAARGEGQWNTFRNGQIVNKEKFTAGKEPSVAN